MLGMDMQSFSTGALLIFIYLFCTFDTVPFHSQRPPPQGGLHKSHKNTIEHIKIII